MYQLFRCCFCDFTGSKDEVKKHEEKCEYNPVLKMCKSCVNGRKRLVRAFPKECDIEFIGERTCGNYECLKSRG